MSQNEFSAQLINSIKPGAAGRLKPEKGFFPVRAGFIRCHTTGLAQKIFSQPHYALVYIIKGHGQFRYPDGRTFPLQPGSLIQRFPNDPHYLEFNEGQKGIWAFMGIPAACMEILKISHLVSSENPVVFPGCSDDIVLNYQSLIARIQLFPEMKIATLITEMQQFAVDLLSRARATGQGKETEDIINKACELLRSQIDRRMDMEKVAADLNMSYSKFRKLFRQALEISPGQYRINYRIEKACEMLRNSTSTIENIAALLGYADSATFSKQFKKITKTSPKKYRLQPDS